MRLPLRSAFVLILFCGFVANYSAQQPQSPSVKINVPVGQPTNHGAALAWPVPADATASTTYTVWRISTGCPGQPGALQLAWTQVVTGITANAYTDANLKVGTYCWMVTQTQGTPPATVRSFPSNMVGGTVTPNALTLSISPT